MNNLNIETAGLNAWPAFSQVDDDGWIARFADGYTKRANSVTVLQPKSDSTEMHILQYERLYNEKGQPCIFRLLSFNDNSVLETLLDARGYTKGDHSIVLSQDLKNREFKAFEFESITIEAWMRHYCELSGKEINMHSTHIRIIKNIRGKYLPAVLSENNNIISCGLGVISDGLFGIFDIVTNPQYRKKGYGYKLINGMLHWAIRNSASGAYVQVVAENTPAVGLYRKLGYEPAYEYHYKIQQFTQHRD